MPGFNSISGDEAIMFADNASFDGTQRGGKMTTNGQLWIGSTAAAHVKLGNITSPSGTVTIGYSSPNITLDVAGGTPTLMFAVDTTTGGGTNPVIPTAGGQVTVTGGQYATGTFGTRVITINSPSANTFAVDAQISSAVGASNITKNGLSHFNSSIFTVDANGFVSAPNGGYISLSPFIVGTDIHSGYNTIAAAIAAAISAGASSSSPANIYIKPKSGGYTENPVLQDGINLIGLGGFSVLNSIQPQIIGKVTFSGAGIGSLTGLNLTTNSDYIIEITGSSAVNINITSCFINLSNANGIHITNSSANILLLYCTSNNSSNSIFISTAGSIYANYCNLIGAGTSTFAGSNFSGAYSAVESPFSSSGSASMQFQHCIVTVPNTTALNFNSSGAHLVYFSTILSGTGSCIAIGGTATVPVVNTMLQSSNTNVITGTGILQYAFISFFGSSSGTNVSTQTPYATLI